MFYICKTLIKKILCSVVGFNLIQNGSGIGSSHGVNKVGCKHFVLTWDTMIIPVYFFSILINNRGGFLDSINLAVFYSHCVLACNEYWHGYKFLSGRLI